MMTNNPNNSQINQQHLVIVNHRKEKSKTFITKIKNIMKKFKRLLVILTATLLIISCKKEHTNPDPQTPPTCSQVCQNGGRVNANCGCDCPAGYTGANCETALSLRSVTVTRIDVINFPSSYKVGQVAYYWDAGTTSSKYPDIYININAGTHSISTQSSPIYMNVNSVPQTYTIDAINLPSPSNNYSIGLYDYDGVSVNPQFMGGIYFKPIDFKKGYPVSFPLANTAGTIKYIIYVTWNF